MANYDFYGSGTSTAVSGITKQNFATPGDTSQICLRRGRVDTTKQSLTTSDVARVFPVYADEIILGVWLKVDTAESTSNGAVDIGVDGGFVIEADANVETVNAVVHNPNAAQFVASNGNLTLKPNNGVTIDSAIVNVTAMITKDFDRIGPSGD